MKDTFLVDLIVAVSLSVAVIYGVTTAVRWAGIIILNSQRPNSCNLEEYREGVH